MRRRTLAAGAALTLTAAALATNFALPSVAEDRMRDELASFGAVTSVEVSASPGLKLLFGGVDRAAVEMSSATLDAGTMDSDMLARAGEVGVLRARIDTLRAGPLDVESVVLDKRGEELDGSASLDLDQVERLLPGAELTVEDGKVLLGFSDLPLPLPIPGGLQLELAVEDGSVVARPLGAASALLPAQPLLDRPELEVTSLHGRLTDGQVKLSASAVLNDV